ncbi:hypothetical protein HAZT_HAZT006580 [Hyalella azteca]|uniref:Laminin G domain-containing protein n=1 Tax=Hyalella azteca TaxID=294128 RepID=A0A6A0HBM7_HYAAZ|nr:hypothetical protein HAZT_HAZT006580 [Hyalella azteca]
MARDAKAYRVPKLPVSITMQLLIAFLSLLDSSVIISAFILEGSVSSYAQYPRWTPAGDGSLDFLFSTSEPDGLLFYTDNESSTQFFQLTLVEGTARLRYNLGLGNRLVSAGRSLNDGFWHHVRVQKSGEIIELRVDDSVETHQGTHDHTFGSNDSSGSVFFGGIPPDVTRLSGSVVALQPRFAGKIKDVTYREADGVAKRPEMTASQVSNN